MGHLSCHKYFIFDFKNKSIFVLYMKIKFENNVFGRIRFGSFGKAYCSPRLTRQFCLHRLTVRGSAKSDGPTPRIENKNNILL